MEGGLIWVTIIVGIMLVAGGLLVTALAVRRKK
jgi:hypothetical protein